MRQSIVALSLLALTLAAAAAEPVALSRDPNQILADALALVGPPEGAPAKELRIKPGDRVAFMGDSITAGGGYVRLAAAVLNTNYPDLKLPGFINAGVSGQKAENMAPRFAKDMQLTNKTAWTFISVGISRRKWSGRYR